MTVIGGSLAARGNDNPHGLRQTHSPTAFIEDLGAAFRASGLREAPARPVLDPPLPRQLVDPADGRRPALDLDRDRRLPEARPAARRARSASRRRSSTASTGSRPQIPRARARPLLRRRARRRSGRSSERAPGGRLRRGDPARRLPAARADADLLPRHRRVGVHRAPDRALLPERPAEGEPAARGRFGPGGRDRPGKMRVRERRAVFEGQYVAYTFFKAKPEWRRLPVEERAAGKDAFAEVIDEFAPRFDYLNVVLDDRRPARTATSSSGRSPGATRTSASSARRSTRRRSPAGSTTPYSYLATTKASQYTSARRAAEDHPAGLAVPASSTRS